MDSGTNRKFGRTGLGLTLVKKLVEMHNGKYGLKVNLVKGVDLHLEIQENRID
ncbi:hypothetical protein [Methanohalobium sp.]|uniref:hypothetical protein n=1 Tax=Methanohalobium sp. TaxID=2837493 RepID=UPI0025F67FDB|nr:hypothetical protein [Methanohalobium sp.]